MIYSLMIFLKSKKKMKTFRKEISKLLNPNKLCELKHRSLNSNLRRKSIKLIGNSSKLWRVIGK